MPDVIHIEIQDRIATVTVNRPEVRNALNTQVILELTAAFEQLATRSDVGAIILTGAGDKAFVAGADIKEMVGKSGLEMQAFSEMGRRLGDAMERCPKPILAAINGYALGGGCELAMACDLRLASENAKIGQAEINIGIIPGYGGSQRLPRLVGSGWAAQMVFTGEPVDAATAERIGLVNKVVPADRLLDEARGIARKILEKSPVAVSLAKSCLRASQEMPLPQGLSYETAAFGVAGATQDKIEGMTAFLEKRKPVWKGA
jgi:enoyl-CoA hydratase